jgi:hypothetical protein
MTALARISFRQTIVLLAIGLLTLQPLSACIDPLHPAQEAANLFAAAMKQGDSELVHQVLDTNVLIFESGNIESSLEEYASHHLEADIAFMEDIDKEIISQTLIEDSNLVIISTSYRMFGTYKDQEFDKTSLETLVLRQMHDGWKIVHIHWS